MQKRALIITDSLGAPRYEPEIVTYEQTWVYGVKEHLEQNDFDVFIITHNGLHSFDLLRLAETKLNLYSPQLVILQFGIVDCAPRVLREKEILIFRVLKIGKIAHYIAKRFHAPLSKLRNISLFSPRVFEQNVEQIYKFLKSNNPRIVQIPIAPACSGYKNTSPRIEQNISAYNHILKKYSDIYISEFTNLPQEDIESLFMSDHHHLSHRGHMLLQNMTLKAIGTIA